MVDKKTENVKTDSWIDTHDLNEVIETTNLDILPKYDLIKESDLITVRKVVIMSLPKNVEVVKKGKMLSLHFITISDNGINYSLPFNSIALQRSFLSIAIKESKAKSKTEIDLSKVLGKMLGLKREQFEAHGFIQAPLKFFLLEN